MRKTMRKVIISVAPINGSSPLDTHQLVYDVTKCVEAGASMCHLHCRKEDGSLTADTTYMIECFDNILQKTDVVVQASTGGVSDLTIEERCNPLNYPRVETASLNGGSTNLGEFIYHNSFSDISYCADMVYSKQIIPEIEVFDIGMIHNIEITKKDHPFYDPLLFNLVFGHKGGMQPTIESLVAFTSFVPKDALWGVTHFGRDNWTFLAAAIAMGASVVRVGFEDSNYLSDDTSAIHNYQIVEKLVNLLHAMDLEPATPIEARKMLSIFPKS